MTNLRNYQIAAIQNLRSAFASSRRVMLYSPTGSGKTVIAEEIIKSALARGKRVAFIVNRVGLLQQTSRRLHHIRHGILQSINTRGIENPLVIASIQTVAKRGLPHVDLIIIDEAHAVPGSRDYRQLLANYNNVPVLGLTATPFARGLGGFNADIGGPIFEDLVSAATIRELIEQGHLVDCDIFAPTDPDLVDVRLQRNAFGEIDFNAKDLGRAVNKPKLVGDIVHHWQRLANNAPTVVFATNIAHSKAIVAEFVAAGVSAEHIDCYTDDDERQAIMQRVQAGVTRIISNVAILTEGWDFPGCSVMVLARPTRSLTLFVQMAGRILRPAPGKTRALIIDHSGSAVCLGYPTEDLPLQLDDGLKRDRKARVAEAPKPSKCPACSFIKPPKTHRCPACGFAPERKPDVATVTGDLQKLDRKKPSADDKQRVYSELVAIAFERGFKIHWASHKYREFFGVWPRNVSLLPKAPSQEVINFVKSRQIAFSKSKVKEQQNASTY